MQRAFLNRVRRYNNSLKRVSPNCLLFSMFCRFFKKITKSSSVCTQVKKKTSVELKLKANPAWCSGKVCLLILGTDVNVTNSLFL